MKIPGAGGLRKIKEEVRKVFFPTEADEAAAVAKTIARVEADYAATKRAEEETADRLRRRRAERLRPHIGSLFVVIDFWGVGLEENADRIRDVVLSDANLGPDATVGTVAILSNGREDHKTLKDTASALKDSFVGTIGTRAFLQRSEREDSDVLVLSLARAAEESARQATHPGPLGCIAAVAALDMQWHADGPQLPLPGTALKLTGINEDARLIWETISKLPNAHEL